MYSCETVLTRTTRPDPDYPNLAAGTCPSETGNASKGNCRMRTEEENQRSLQLAEEVNEFLVKKSYGTPDDEIIALARVLEARLELLPAGERDRWFTTIIDALKVARQDLAAADKG